jgi:hypothetical protein
MSTVNKIKFYLYSGLGLGGCVAMVILVMYFALRTLPEAKKTIGIRALDGYGDATEAAMDAWNSGAGCEFLIPGDDVIVQSESGMPCGDTWRPESEWGHSATAYRCLDHSEIWVSEPGNIHTQAHIIGHEIGHTLDRPHQSIGLMGRPPDPNGGNKMLRISDADKKAVRERFCK